MPSYPFAVIPTPLGAITAGNERSTNPAAHLGEFDTLGMTWKSSGAANLWAQGEFTGGAKPIDFMGLLAANAGPGTTIRLRLAASAAALDPVPVAVTNQQNTAVTSLGSNTYRVTKNTASPGFDASAASAVVLDGDYTMRIKPLQANRAVYVGASATPAITNAASISPSLYFDAAGTVFANGPDPIASRSYSANDFFYIRRAGGVTTALYGGDGTIATATQFATLPVGTATVGLDSSIFDSAAAFEVQLTSGGGYDSGTLPFINPAITSEDELYSSHLELPATMTYGFWRIDIGGHTGDFEAAVLVLGQKIQPATFYNPGFAHGVDDLGGIETGPYGVEDETPGLVFRTLEFQLGWLSTADFEAKFRPLMRKLGKRRKALWCFDPTPNTARQANTYFGRLRSALAARHVFNTADGPRFSQDFEIISPL